MYLFLDIDGVLNRESDWVHPYTVNRTNVKSLAKLMEALPDAQIVLTSSWRAGWEESCDSCTPQIQALRDILGEYGLSISGKTAKAPDGNRLREISHFLNGHPKAPYLILDDDEGEYPVRPDQLYLTDPKAGLTDADIKRIRKTKPYR
jgi:hypothetical protein